MAWLWFICFISNYLYIVSDASRPAHNKQGLIEDTSVSFFLTLGLYDNWQIMTLFNKRISSDLRAAPVSRARTSPTTIPPALIQKPLPFLLLPENNHNSNIIHKMTQICKPQCNIKARQRNLYLLTSKDLCNNQVIWSLIAEASSINTPTRTKTT